MKAVSDGFGASWLQFFFLLNKLHLQFMREIPDINHATNVEHIAMYLVIIILCLFIYRTYSIFFPFSVTSMLTTI